YARGGAIRPLIDRWLRAGRARPRVIMELGDVEAIKRLVAAGLGWSVASAGAGGVERRGGGGGGRRPARQHGARRRGGDQAPRGRGAGLERGLRGGGGDGAAGGRAERPRAAAPAGAAPRGPAPPRPPRLPRGGGG